MSRERANQSAVYWRRTPIIFVPSLTIKHTSIPLNLLLAFIPYYPQFICLFAYFQLMLVSRFYILQLYLLILLPYVPEEPV